jgi:hypothetical protein
MRRNGVSAYRRNGVPVTAWKGRNGRDKSTSVGRKIGPAARAGFEPGVRDAAERE